MFRVFFLSFLICAPSQGAEWSVQSPNGRITLSAVLSQEGVLFWQATLDTISVFSPESTGLQTSIADGRSGLHFESVETRDVENQFSVPSGKAREIFVSYREMRIHFSKDGFPFQFVVRVSNDGIAYRWEVPFVLNGPSLDGLRIYWENGGFRIPPGSLLWAMRYWPQEYSYETIYEKISTQEAQGSRRALPILVNSGATWMLLFEASPEPSYTGAHLYIQENAVLKLQPDVGDYLRGSLPISLPFQTPWRAAILSDGLGQIVESNWPLILGPDQAPYDFSWVRPGRASWSWYSGLPVDSLPVNKMFIDLASDFGWEYTLLDLGWQEAWMPELLQYAREKNVRVLLWEEYRKLVDPWVMEETFAKWESWGIAGVKIDFFNSERQEIQALYDRILDSTARHHLLINFHGTNSKIITMKKKWPHLLTAEAVYGEEQRVPNRPNWVRDFNTVQPFTRNVLGSMDSTLAPFARRGDETLAHLTALTVINESGIGHFAGTDAEYRDSPARPFLEKVPAAWDETRFLEGEPNNSFVIARRSGSEWYIGAIALTERTFQVKLDFLIPGWRGIASVYSDGVDGSQFLVQDISIQAGETLPIHVLSHGGAAVRLH